MTTKNSFGPQGWTPDRLGSLAGKTYVITGANAGAGFEATRVLLSKGATVVMMNRSAALKLRERTLPSWSAISARREPIC
ncbi:hypothetical protein [Rosistilla oblonga]|uniref:hypothetical protein n=1 Tax=Rosistilla oblonga TaxID=2527990 RepID=UPI003A973E24